MTTTTIKKRKTRPRLSEKARNLIGQTISIKWGTSRGRDSYGYTTASLYDTNGRRAAGCNGGGYDMRGTVVGNWIAGTFADELRRLKPDAMPENSHWQYERISTGRGFYGLCFYDPTYNALDAKLEDVGKTFRQLQAEGKIVDLDIIRAAYEQTSKHATKRHTQPNLDGACGINCMIDVLRAIGLTLNKVTGTSKLDVYQIQRSDAK